MSSEAVTEETTKPKERSVALLLLAYGLAVAVLAFSAGRFTGPVQVEERVEYSDVSRSKQKTKAQTSRAKDTRTTTTPVLLATPDGGVILASKTVTEEREREETKTSTELEAMREAIGRSSVTTTNRPDWRIGALGGVFLGGGVEPRPVVGAIAERRIIGGVNAGLWGLVVIDPSKVAPPAAIIGGGVLAEF